MARFLRRGKARVYFLPSVAGANPTTLEIDAGTNLTARIADMAGWQLESAPIATPDMGSRFESSIPGGQSVAASSLTFYADDAASADSIKTALKVDTAGFIYIQHAGPGVGRTADLFPSRVSAVGNEYSTGNDPARFAVNFAITAPPTIDGPVPA